nr:holo-ACP synthase [Clostridiales bacterium]
MFVGNDIIEVSRIANLIENDKFLHRIYSSAEIKYCEDKANKAQNYAARFAAKEAVFKALSSKLNGNFSINWNEICVEKDDNGRPFIILYNHSEISDNYRFDLSLSHVKEYAIANVIMYSKV